MPTATRQTTPSPTFKINCHVYHLGGLCDLHIWYNDALVTSNTLRIRSHWMNAKQIQAEFISLLNHAGVNNAFRCQFWNQGTRRISRNIADLSGSIDCLVYFKVRSEQPYRWGVTANRINELKQSGRKWVLVLLYESPRTGYFITAKDVEHYLSIWPLGNDGDYKVGPGSYLKFNKPFCSFPEFLGSLLNL